MRSFFTLIELIIVIVVLGILAAVVVPNIGTTKDNAESIAISANKHSIQVAVDWHSFHNKGELPVIGKPSLGNPRPLDLNLLVPDKIRNIPNGVHYSVNESGKVSASTASSPVAVNVISETGEVYWNHVDGAESYNVYRKLATLGTISNEEQLLLVENVSDNFFRGIPQTDYLVSVIDKFGNETFPIGENYNGEIRSYFEFNGEGDYLVASNSELLDMDTNDFTIEVWAKGEFQERAGILGKGNWFERGNDGYFIAYPHNPKYIYVGVRDGEERRIIRTEQLDNVFGWNHIALVRESNKIKLFVNGEEESVDPEREDEVYGSLSNSSPFVIGKNPIYSSFFKGGISEVRVWDYARSPEQLKRELNKKLTGEEKGLLSAWRFDSEEDGLKDLSPNGNHLISHGHTFID